jgi:hypothetical protein
VVRKSRKKPEQLSKPPSSGHRIFATRRRQMLELALFESPRPWFLIVLFLTFIRQRVGEHKRPTFGEKRVCANLGVAQSQSRVFLRMSNRVSPRHIVVASSGWCQIEENLEGYQVSRRWLTTTPRSAATSQSRGV